MMWEYYGEDSEVSVGGALDITLKTHMGYRAKTRTIVIV